MGMLRFNYRSQALGYYVNITVVYPTLNYSFYNVEENRGFHGQSSKVKGVYHPGMKFQTVYLIHGGSDDDSLTYRFTNAERYAEENNVMLVTPGIQNSFGVDACYGVQYHTFLTEELPVVIQSLFASSSKREDNFIVGYAMGGNIALGTALLRPDLYSACVDISGGIGMTLDTDMLKSELEGEHFRNNFYLYNAAFGSAEDIEQSKFNVYKAAKYHKEQKHELCKFFFACGGKEFIRFRLEKDVQLLKELGYDVQYILDEDMDHDFSMWDKYIGIALNQLLNLDRDVHKP